MKRLIKGIDITGEKFGKLTPIKVVGKNKRRQLMWKCKCDCGNTTVTCGSEMRLGRVLSCGCLRDDVVPIHRNPKAPKYRLGDKYGIGYTNKGTEFYFDLEDYDKIKNHSWSENKKGYIYTCIGDKTMLLHRFILNATQIVDHINHNKKDNRKCNLRECTPSQNAMNRANIKGISFNKSINKWKAVIGLSNKCIWLGYFINEQDAINARKKAEEKYFGEFAYKENKNIIN